MKLQSLSELISSACFSPDAEMASAMNTLDAGLSVLKSMSMVTELDGNVASQTSLIQVARTFLSAHDGVDLEGLDLDLESLESTLAKLKTIVVNVITKVLAAVKRSVIVYLAGFKDLTAHGNELLLALVKKTALVPNTIDVSSNLSIDGEVTAKGILDTFGAISLLDSDMVIDNFLNTVIGLATNPGDPVTLKDRGRSAVAAFGLGSGLSLSQRRIDVKGRPENVFCSPSLCGDAYVAAYTTYGTPHIGLFKAKGKLPKKSETLTHDEAVRIVQHGLKAIISAERILREVSNLATRFATMRTYITATDNLFAAQMDLAQAAVKSYRNYATDMPAYTGTVVTASFKFVDDSIKIEA